jgi:hypothetical protein
MRTSFLSYPVVGISFSRHRVVAVSVRRSWRCCVYEDYLQHDVENLLDPEGDYSILAAALSHAVRQLAVAPSAVLRVALPGPLVQTTVLRVEERPKSRREAEALITWHVARQTGAGKPRHVAAHCISRAIGDHRLYGIAVDESLYRCIEEALAAERCALEVVDAATTCRWNSLPEVVRGRPGVLVDIQDAYWSLMMWGKMRHPLLVKSGWRTPGGGAAEADRMAREVFRLLASAGQEGGGGQAEGFFLLARPEEAGIAGDALLQTAGIAFDLLAAGANTCGDRVRGLPATMAGCPALEIACAR